MVVVGPPGLVAGDGPDDGKETGGIVNSLSLGIGELEWDLQELRLEREVV